MPSHRLVNASQAPRCQHLKVNGLRCGSPARHARRYCCFHDSAVRRNREFVLPIVEDAASLQLALNKIMQALVDKLIDQKTASTLLYGLQIASANLKRLDGEQFRDKLDRMARARREQEHRQTSAQPGGAEAEPEHQPESQPAKAAAAAATQTASPVDEFLRKIANRKLSITNEKENDKGPRFDIQACIDPVPHRFDINACAALVPQGRTLVAQDGSPGKRSRASSESRRDGARLHVSRHDSIGNRQSEIGNAAFVLGYRPSAIDHRRPWHLLLDARRESSSNGQHGC